jgi:dolichol-phosphate mannosyltransferase
MKSMIVIPTYNERENIEKIVPVILSLKDEFSIIIVDDNSPDGTGSVADRMAQENSRVHVLHRPKKMGLGTAYIEGFRYALSRGADYVFEMDADCSHDPGELHKMLEGLQQADVVVGSRYYEGVRVNGWRFRRLLLSKLANMFASYVIVIPIWDFTAGFVCYRRSVLEGIDFSKIRSNGYAFQIEMKTYAYRKGFTISEIPIIFYGRESGDSKLNRGIAWEAFWTVLKLRSPLMVIIKHMKYLYKD